MAKKPRKPQTKLSQDQKEKAANFINERWKGAKNCPVCDNKEWTLAEHTVTSLVIRGNDIQGSGTTYPMVMAICTNCGDTRFFSAVRMGIMDMAWEEEEEEAGEEKKQEKPEEAKSDG